MSFLCCVVGLFVCALLRVVMVGLLVLKFAMCVCVRVLRLCVVLVCVVFLFDCFVWLLMSSLFYVFCSRVLYLLVLFRVFVCVFCLFACF